MKAIRKVVAGITCALAAHAGATVLDFEDDPYAGQYRSTSELWGTGSGTGSEIETQGFTLRYTPAKDDPYPTGFQAVGPLWRYNYRDTIAINPNSCSAKVVLGTSDGMPFDLYSIDLQELNGVGAVPASVSFTGKTRNGKEVTLAVTLDQSPEWQTIQFPDSFRQLQELTWRQGDCYTNAPHMFDNIRLAPFVKHADS